MGSLYKESILTGYLHLYQYVGAISQKYLVLLSHYKYTDLGANLPPESFSETGPCIPQ